MGNFSYFLIDCCFSINFRLRIIILLYRNKKIAKKNNEQNLNTGEIVRDYNGKSTARIVAISHELAHYKRI